jgi:glyoxylase-like metal-dependent hydrolase (beta-lactamase superfamily II)
VNGIQLGVINVTRTVEMECPLFDPLVLFPDATAEDLQAEMSWLAPTHYSPVDGQLVLAVQSFLLRSGSLTVLVDTCVGDCRERGTPGFNRLRTGWLERLQDTCAAGDVDIVVCTHLHVDHVGWNTMWRDDRWVPTFPEARYLFTAPDFDWFGSAHAEPGYRRSGHYWRDSIQPIVDAGLCDVVSVDHRISDAISLRHTPGHTPGHVSVQIESGTASGIITGDVIHSPLQLKHPEWSTAGCIDPAAATRSRLALLGEAADRGSVLFPSHFAAPTACLVHRRDAAFDLAYLDAG